MFESVHSAGNEKSQKQVYEGSAIQDLTEIQGIEGGRTCTMGSGDAVDCQTGAGDSLV